MRQSYQENPRLRAAVRLALTGGSLAASFGVHGQEAAKAPTDTSLQEVVVTGSRIAAVPNETSISPVTFIGAESIAQSGVTRVEDLSISCRKYLPTRAAPYRTDRTALPASICAASMRSAPWCWSTVYG